jgi:hypothetical protein
VHPDLLVAAAGTTVPTVGRATRGAPTARSRARAHASMHQSHGQNMPTMQQLCTAVGVHCVQADPGLIGQHSTTGTHLTLPTVEVGVTVLTPHQNSGIPPGPCSACHPTTAMPPEPVHGLGAATAMHCRGVMVANPSPPSRGKRPAGHTTRTGSSATTASQLLLSRSCPAIPKQISKRSFPQLSVHQTVHPSPPAERQPQNS